jgi:hypothetical protein
MQERTKTMIDRKTPRLLRFAAVAMLFIGVAACDEATTPDDDVMRSLPCNLAEEECAGLPAAAEAVVLLESLDVDVERVDVELVEDVDEAEDAASVGDRSIDDLTSELPPPEEQRWTCNGGDGVMCCCLWDGPEWGCYCN